MLNSQQKRMADKMILEVVGTLQKTGQLLTDHLYTKLQSYGATIDQCKSFEAVLLQSGRVVKRDDLLVWNG